MHLFYVFIEFQLSLSRILVQIFLSRLILSYLFSKFFLNHLYPSWKLEGGSLLIFLFLA